MDCAFCVFVYPDCVLFLLILSFAVGFLCFDVVFCIYAICAYSASYLLTCCTPWWMSCLLPAFYFLIVDFNSRMFWVCNFVCFVTGLDGSLRLRLWFLGCFADGMGFE